MSLLRTETEAREQFRLDAARRVEEAHGIWAAFAQSRSLPFVVVESGLPAFAGYVEGTEVAVNAVGSVDLGFRTRSIAAAKIPLRGKVKVAPPGDWDEIVSHVWTPHFFGEPELDRLLVVKTSSQSLAHTVLDPRVVQTLRVLAPARCELSYEDGAISLLWAGIERDYAILDDVLDVLGYLAVRGNEASPYR